MERFMEAIHQPCINNAVVHEILHLQISADLRQSALAQYRIANACVEVAWTVAGALSLAPHALANGLTAVLAVLRRTRGRRNTAQSSVCAEGRAVRRP
jgi:hypothetical protein